jgi:type VI secretion system protein ImpF
VWFLKSGMMRPTHTMLLPSVFDRLADISLQGADSSAWYDVETLTSAVRRDLEDLLNTQKSIPALAADFPMLSRSVVGYGVPDPSTYPLETPLGRRRFASDLRQTIETFEPRLTEVQVELAGNQGEKFRELRFRVIAKLTVESAPRLVFESVLHVPTGQFSIEGTHE